MTSPVSSLPAVTLVFGGASSGKSRFAEALIDPTRYDRVYLATAEARDDEMADRIRRHRERRDKDWRTVEAPVELAAALRAQSISSTAILVDCLTLWMSNLLEHGRDLDQEAATLVATLAELDAPVVIVSNEVGMGIVPANRLAREFRDHAGRLNQQVAQAADRVVFVAAGLPLVLKDRTA